MDASPIVLATRGSALALAQARWVRDRFQELLPQRRTSIQVFRTTGDALQGGESGALPEKLPKGLFTREIEDALLDRRADVAVHSLKDLPTELPTGLRLSGVSLREDPREVVLALAPLSPPFLRSLPSGALVGTGSPRRQALLAAQRPDLGFEPLRGNVPTRIARLAASSGLEALVLAGAGMRRLGYGYGEGGLLEGLECEAPVYAYPLPLQDLLPCVGQGAIGLETREDDAPLIRLCERFSHLPTRLCVEAERSFLRGMGGGCLSPVAAHAWLEGSAMHMSAAHAVEGDVRRSQGEAPEDQGELLAARLAEELR